MASLRQALGLFGGVARPGRGPADMFVPESLACLREGYSRGQLLGDLQAGVTVGLIALPLAMAFAIASHVPPVAGLYTAIIAGFLISLLGGSRVQIGGPTGAFVVIIAAIVDQHGYDGLVLASLLAGLMIVAMGLLRFGGMIKFIPYPVTTGFTAGIAVIIFSGQMKDLFGLSIAGKTPGEFVEQWRVYIEAARHGVNPSAVGIGVGGLLMMMAIRRWMPRLPGAVVAVVAATAAVWIFNLDSPQFAWHVETIGSRFGTADCPSGIPAALPALHLPRFDAGTLEQIRLLLPAAGTIAMLAGIESLLSAVVADGMIGGRHKSNCELLAQGVANVASVLFGGIPATGAIARTAANIKSGGRTPLAGMVHALTLLLFVLLFGRLAARIPLAIFASVLIMVAWHMSDFARFRMLLRAPRSDVFVLLATFGLTVFADLTVAVGIGLVLASLLFTRRMTEMTSLMPIREEVKDLPQPSELNDPNSLTRRDVPPGIEVYEINGPFFFGAADLLQDVLRGLELPPKIFILRMRRVTSVDATGLNALEEFHMKCSRQQTRLLLAGVHAQPIAAMTRYGLLDRIGTDNMFGNIDDALNAARTMLGLPPQPRPQGAQPEVARERAGGAAAAGG